jgi:hypothetical protein
MNAALPLVFCYINAVERRKPGVALEHCEVELRSCSLAKVEDASANRLRSGHKEGA